MAIGGLFTFGLSYVYIFVSTRLQDGAPGEAVTAAFGTVSAISAAFPNISFMIRFMFEGSIPGLLISLAVSLAVIVLFLLRGSTFLPYFFPFQLKTRRYWTKQNVIYNCKNKDELYLWNGKEFKKK